MDIKKQFDLACFRRAQYIWWMARGALLPCDTINILATNDEEFMKLMDEREVVLRESFEAANALHNLSLEFSEKNTQEQCDSACQEVYESYEEVIEKSKVLIEKFEELLAIHHAKEENPDDKPNYYKKAKKHSDKLVHERRSSKRAQRKSNA